MNRSADVVAVQTLLNEHAQRGAKPNRIQVTGSVDPKTIAAIEAFQAEVLKVPEPDGRVDPNGPTLRRLNNTTRGGGRRPLPAFSRMWDSYPTVRTPCDGPYDNQCAIRASIALIGAGFSLAGYTEPVCRHGHARGAESLANFIARTAGQPQILKPEHAKTSVEGRSGLVFFRNIEGFRNSRGDHMDLWNGSKTQTGAYFNVCQQIWFWWSR
jgi:hypothetical protein